METTMVNFFMNKDLKREMESVFKQMGITMSAAFTIFAKTVGREKRIPFNIYAEQTNALRILSKEIMILNSPRLSVLSASRTIRTRQRRAMLISKKQSI